MDMGGYNIYIRDLNTESGREPYGGKESGHEKIHYKTDSFICDMYDVS